MIAICHFLALVISNPFLVKLGRRNLLIWARILNIDFFFKVMNYQLALMFSAFKSRCNQTQQNTASIPKEPITIQLV